MGQSNNYTRNQKLYTNDYEGRKVFPLNSVPELSKRPKGSWTKGVMAWGKGLAGSNDKLIGWFAPPRLKKSKSEGGENFETTLKMQEEE